MAIHILLFLVDMLLWLTAGAFIAVRYYPDQRVKQIWRKRGFILRAFAGAMTGGMYAMLEKGLTHPLVMLYHISLAILMTVIFLSIASPAFYVRALGQTRIALNQIQKRVTKIWLIITNILIKKSMFLKDYIPHAK